MEKNKNKIIQESIQDYQEYFNKDIFLNKRSSGLKLVSYLIAFWEIKEDEVDFRE